MTNYHIIDPNDLDQAENTVIRNIENQEYQEDINDFLQAALTGHPDIMKEIISFSNLGSDIVNASGSRGERPLHLAAARGHHDVVEHLLNISNINVNSQDHEGLTPLHLASERGNLNLIRYLMDRGADVSIQNHEGETARDWLEDWAKETNNLDIVDQMLDEMEGTIIGQTNYTNYNYIPEN